MNAIAGDFEEVYGAQELDDSDEPQAGKWNAVITCFFIDTVTTSAFHPRVSLIATIKAKNIINYLRIIHRILAPGGVWINLGKFEI